MLFSVPDYWQSIDSTIFFNFAKNCTLSCWSNIDNIKKFTMPFLNYKPLKL